jgi:DNA-binding MarR family transcriptional regulator
MDMTPTVTEPLIALDAVMRAARIFASITAESVAQTGDAVTLPQLRILVLASTRPALNNTEVADALDVHLSNASRTCDRLVQAGLLSRRESRTDRRRVELSVTGEGERLLAAITSHRQAAFSRILKQMPPQDQLTLASALDSFTDLADQHIEHRYTPL